MTGISRIKVIIFDFDGTLIDSNALKYSAFFPLFPNESIYREAVESVLADSPEGSRYVVLPRILDVLPEAARAKLGGVTIETLAMKYNDLVIAGIRQADTADTLGLLRRLSGCYKVYLSSTTPEKSLKQVVRELGWDECFVEVFGYPSEKEAVAGMIIKRERISPEELIIVGDGDSDRQAAEAVKSKFLSVDIGEPLASKLQEAGVRF